MKAGTLIDGTANHIGAVATVSNQFLFLFDLTSPASVHLTGSVVGEKLGVTGFASLADAQLLLTGPGLQFERDACPQVGAFFCGPPLTFDEQFLLNPGIYTFSALTEASNDSGGLFSGTAVEAASLSVNADITTIPEPRWVPIILTLLVTICCAVTRWRCAGPNDLVTAKK